MGLMDNLKAQTAKLRMEIGKLNDRREKVFLRIGEQVYARAGSGDTSLGFEAEVEELRALDADVAAKQAEIERIRTEEGAAETPVI